MKLHVYLEYRFAEILRKLRITLISTPAAEMPKLEIHIAERKTYRVPLGLV